MKYLQYIPAILRNKYLLTLVGFVVWMLFFDDRDFITTQFRHKTELNQLLKSKSYYEGEIKMTRKELNDLKSDPAILEQYAREKYFMKRDHEDLFIFSN